MRIIGRASRKTQPPAGTGGPAAFPSRLSTSGRNIVDENGYVMPKFRGFNMHVVPWAQTDFDAMSAKDTRTTKAALDRIIVRVDYAQPSSGTAIDATWLANLDTTIARAIVAQRYVMFEIHLNIGAMPTWMQSGLDETDQFCKAGTNNGQYLTEFLAKRYGDPTDPLGAGKYTKAVVGLGLNEPPVNGTTMNSAAGSVPYLEDHQARVAGWMRTYAPNWIAFVAWSYASGTPNYTGPGEDTSKTDANPAHAVYNNAIIDIHDYMLRDNTESSTAAGRQFNGSIYTWHNGGPLMGPGDETTYTSTATHRQQHANFYAPYVAWCAANSKPLWVGEWGWVPITNADATGGAGQATSGEQAYIDDKQIAWTNASTIGECVWNYDVTTNTAVNPWAARPGGGTNWRISTSDWLAGP